MKNGESNFLINRSCSVLFFLFHRPVILLIDESEDGFTLVTHKHRSNRPKKSTSNRRGPSIPVPTPADPALPKDLIVNQVKKAAKEINSSKFFTTALKSVDKALKETGQSSIDQILCYGLGRYSDCITARYQLGFLLAVKDRFQSEVFVFDPLFSTTEQEILPESFDCELIRENEEGKRKLTPDICTLLFAPHCPKQLTNNFLWANWNSNLKNCIILGNSFLKVIFNPTCLIESAQYILKISPYTTEYSLTNSFRFKDIFNDLAYHTFDLDKANPEFWNISDIPPEYPENDVGVLIKDNHDNQTSSSTSKRTSQDNLGEEIKQLAINKAHI